MSLNDREMNQWLIDFCRETRCWRVNFEELTPAERVFRCIWELESQVTNGGFRQYFDNSGELAPFVVDALTSIRAFATAEVVTQAIARMGRLQWDDPNIRYARSKSLGVTGEADLAVLTDRFFEYPDNLTRLLYTFVQDHKADFGIQTTN